MEVDAKVVQRGANAILVFVFTLLCNMDVSLGGVELFVSEKYKWVKTKTRIALAPLCTTFASTST